MADSEAEQPRFAVRFAEGAENFNAGRFWEAHESWETLWLVSESEMRKFLQGLIQLAAAYLHLGRSNFSGAVRLFDSALVRLEDFPDGYCGVLRKKLTRQALADRKGAASALASPDGSAPRQLATHPPVLSLTENWQSQVPHGDQW